MLLRSIELNGYANIRVMHVALSDREGIASLQIGATSGAHTLSPEFDGLRAVSVPTKTLDGVVAENRLASVDMIKIDVQGLELAVLRGASKTLHANPRAVLLLDLPKQSEKRRAIGEYLAQFGFTYFADGDEHAPTRDIPAAAFEVAAMRLQA